MRVSELLISIASWLESPDNEALLLAEYDEATLSSAASALSKAASILKEGASEVEATEPASESVLTTSSLEEMAALAQSFDASGDETLIKQANLLDELLISISADKDLMYKFKLAEEKKINDIKNRYNSPERKEYVIEAEKALDKSPMMKTYRPLEAPLSTRTCLDHPGAQMGRVDETSWQCSLDGKIYDYADGFTTMKGNKVPGGAVTNQTGNLVADQYAIFDTRESRLNKDK